MPAGRGDMWPVGLVLGRCPSTTTGTERGSGSFVVQCGCVAVGLEYSAASRPALPKGPALQALPPAHSLPATLPSVRQASGTVPTAAVSPVTGLTAPEKGVPEDTYWASDLQPACLIGKKPGGLGVRGGWWLKIKAVWAQLRGSHVCGQTPGVGPSCSESQFPHRSEVMSS